MNFSLMGIAKDMMMENMTRLTIHDRGESQFTLVICQIYMISEIFHVEGNDDGMMAIQSDGLMHLISVY